MRARTSSAFCHVPTGSSLPPSSSSSVMLLLICRSAARFPDIATARGAIALSCSVHVFIPGTVLYRYLFCDISLELGKGGLLVLGTTGWKRELHCNLYSPNKGLPVTNKGSYVTST